MRGFIVHRRGKQGHLSTGERDRIAGRICAYKGDREEEKTAFFEAHRDATQDVTNELLEAGASAREAGARHKH
jgi:hypothetical protein